MNPHQQRPKILQQHQQIFNQITRNHPHKLLQQYNSKYNTIQTPVQQNTSNISSDYLGSTPTSEQIRKKILLIHQPLQNISYFG